jgi:predicted dehydrogenase
MSRSLNRRDFIKGAAAAGAGFWVAGHYARGEEGSSPSDKLNVGVIGVAHRGGDDIEGLVQTKLVNLVALCDVDENYLGEQSKKFPKAKSYSDYRKMLEQKDLDAVLVATPDHMHAWATLAALRSGRHVYCEKPLAHSVQEIRLVTETARHEKRVTQMGTQIHAERNYRRVVELVQGGVIGPVSEAHVFIDASKNWYQDKPEKTGVPVPPTLHWNQWLGPTPERAYSPDYLPEVWRKWWAFGEGDLGDMGCHYMDLPTWALTLTHPTKIRAQGPPVHSEWCPKWVTAQWDFPAHGQRGPVKLFWYDGGKKPEMLKELNLSQWTDGVLFIGEKGQLIADYSHYKLLPADTFKDFHAPKRTIPDSIGHHKEWVVACMKNEPAAPLCNFSYSGPLSETVLLGCVAYRSGEELLWDAKKMAVTNTSAADPFLKLEYRKGWKL